MKKFKITKRTVSVDNFVGTISVNVDNEKIDDTTFREFIRHTLPIVRFTLGKEKDKRESERGRKDE